MKKRLKTTPIFEIIGIILSSVVIVPLYFVLVNSFKTTNEAADMLLTLPKKINIIENYVRVFKEGKILSAFINSFTITSLSVVIILIISAMAGFILQRRTGKFSGYIDFLIMAGLIVPPAIVPTFWVMKMLHMTSTFQGVILLYAALGFSFSTILYKGFFKTIPREMDEAAIVDGCSSIRMFFSIIMPLLKPVTMTVLIVQFMSVWNDFTVVLYFLSSPTKFTLPLTVYFFFGQYGSYWNLVFADVIIIALPVVIVYMFAQKYIISGMTAGAVKG